MKKSIVVPAAMLLLTGTVLAAHHGPGRMDADADGDGTVTLAEFENAHLERARRHFARLDADGDGLLAESELQRPGHGKRDRKGHDPARLVERLDLDGNGGVSLAEFDGARFAPDAEAFGAADADGDGELNADELGVLMKSHRESRRARPK